MIVGLSSTYIRVPDVTWFFGLSAIVVSGPGNQVTREHNRLCAASRDRHLDIIAGIMSISARSGPILVLTVSTKHTVGL